MTMSTPISNEMLQSAQIALDKYLRINPDEKVLLIFDTSTELVAKAFEKAASNSSINLAARKINPTGGHGRDPDQETVDMMFEYPVIIAPTCFSLTHCSATRRAKEAGARVATLPGINSDIFERGLQVDPLELHDTGQKWIDKISGSHKIKVHTSKGTNIEFEVGDYPFINDDGCIFKTGDSGNLPAGEVFVAPNQGKGNGVLIIDGSIGSMDWELDNSIVKIEIVDGCAVAFEGSRGERLEKALVAHSEAGRVLAEFGIGTNPYLKMNGNLLEDEKVKGTVHFAFGNNRGFGGDNDVPVHIDCMVTAPTVECDSEILMRDGKWKFGI